MNAGKPSGKGPHPPDRWEARYQQSDTPWDIGGPPPVLDDVIASVPEPRRVFVPGAGYGHDAIHWARAGHQVTAIDLAETAVEGARRNAREAGVSVDVQQLDVLALPATFRGAFDIVWEHTCFCALEPERRDAYAQVLAGVLVPDGVVHALLWNHGMESGPPHDITERIAREAFEPWFRFASVRRVEVSAPGRSREFLVRMVMRPREA